MSVELPARAEEQLRNLAARKNRDIDALVEDAVRQYLEAGAISDLEAAEVAKTQMVLAGELRGVDEWKGGLQR